MQPYAETPGGFERTNSRSLSTSSDAEQAQRGSIQAGQTDPSDSNVSTPLQQLNDGRLSSSYHDLHQPSSVGTPQSSFPEEQLSQGSQPSRQQQPWPPSMQQQQQQQGLQPQPAEGERRIPPGTPPLQTESMKSTPPAPDHPQQPGTGMSPYTMPTGSSVVPQYKHYPRSAPSWNVYRERAGGHSMYPQSGYPAAPNTGYTQQARQAYESEYSPSTYGRHSFVVPHPGHPMQHTGMEGVPGSHPQQPYSAHYPYPSMQIPQYQHHHQRNMAVYPSQMSRQLHHQQEMAAYHHHQQQQAQRQQQQQLAMQRYAASGYAHPQSRGGMPSMPTSYHPSSVQAHHFSMSPSFSTASIERDSLHKSSLLQKQQQVAQPDAWSRGSPQRPPSTGSSLSQLPTPQPPISRSRSNDKPQYSAPESKMVSTATHAAKSDSVAREATLKRGRMQDWSTTVEGVSPQLMKFRRIMPQDCGEC